MPTPVTQSELRAQLERLQIAVFDKMDGLQEALRTEFGRRFDLVDKQIAATDKTASATHTSVNALRDSQKEMRENLNERAGLKWHIWGGVISLAVLIVGLLAFLPGLK